MTAPLPVELTPPDITPWRAGNTGVDYVHRHEAPLPGPSVMVQALTHGNEICGAIALDWLLQTGLRPQRGRLTLSFANVEAYARFDAADPYPSRCVDEDLNRVWADDQLFGDRNSVGPDRGLVSLPARHGIAERSAQAPQQDTAPHRSHLDSPPILPVAR